MLFKTRKPKLVEVRVFNKQQKEALFDLFNDAPEKPLMVAYTKSYIDYQIIFHYATNLKGFLFEYKGLYFKYKFKILSITDYTGSR